MKLFLIFIFISNLTLADESDDACNLAKSKANINSSLLAYPKAFANFGNSITKEQSFTMGFSESISGILRSKMIDSAADYQCESYKASVKIETYINWAKQDALIKGANAELIYINKGAALAQENLIESQKLLENNLITIIDFNEARNYVDKFEIKKNELVKMVNSPNVFIEYNDISSLLESYLKNIAKSEELNSQAIADKGWDITGSIGARKILSDPYLNSNSSYDSFATVSIEYSLGYLDAKKSANEIGQNTYKLNSSSQIGFSNTIALFKRELISLINLEKSTSKLSRRSIEKLQNVKLNTEKVDSVLSKNTAKSIELEITINKSIFNGSQERLHRYETLLSQIDSTK